MEDLVVVGDGDVEVAAFDLSAVQLCPVCLGVGVGSLAPWCVETPLDGDLLAVGNRVPGAEVLEHGEDAFFR